MNHAEMMNQLSRLFYDLDAIYYRMSRALNLPESTVRILYSLLDSAEDGKSLQQIRYESGLHKQTLNSALRQLEEQGLLVVAPASTRTKKAILTSQGKAFARNSAGLLLQAEVDAVAEWSDEELENFLELNEKYVLCLQKQAEKLDQFLQARKNQTF